MTTSSVLVTGANRGIGLGLVREYLSSSKKWTVLAACRNPDGAEELKKVRAKFTPNSVQVWFGLIGFIEGSLSAITIHTLELPNWKGFAAFVLLMSCNSVNHGPGLTHLCDLEHPLAGR